MHYPEVRLLRLPEVESVCGRKRSSIYKDIQAGKFPAPIKIGARSVAWNSADIKKWIESRPLAAAATTTWQPSN